MRRLERQADESVTCPRATDACIWEAHLYSWLLPMVLVSSGV